MPGNHRGKAVEGKPKGRVTVYGYRPDRIVGFDMGARGRYEQMVHHAADQKLELPFRDVGEAMRKIVAHERRRAAVSAG